MHRAVALFFCLGVFALCAACSSTMKRVDPVYALHDPDPAKKIRAVKHVVATEDRRHMAQLVDLLEDEDGTVRFIAAKALTRLSGRPVATSAFSTPDERRAEANAWRAWLGANDRGRPPGPDALGAMTVVAPAGSGR